MEDKLTESKLEKKETKKSKKAKLAKNKQTGSEIQEDEMEEDEFDTETKKRKKTSTKENTKAGFEEVPQSKSFLSLKINFFFTKPLLNSCFVEVKLNPEELALGEMMVNSKKVRNQLLDDSYNK